MPLWCLRHRLRPPWCPFCRRPSRQYQHHRLWRLVATLSDLSFDQLLWDLDTSVVAGTDVSASSFSPPQAVSSLPSSSALSPTVGARPKTAVSYPPPDDYVQLRQQNMEQKFFSWWCLHHLKSLPTPPPSAGGEFDMALRRVLRQTAITPSQFDETSSFTDMVNQLYDLHVGTVTKFPLKWGVNFYFLSLFTKNTRVLSCMTSCVIIIGHTRPFLQFFVACVLT